eukprot:351085-Chlamydomonas_euryale.AAC.5
MVALPSAGGPGSQNARAYGVLVKRPWRCLQDATWHRSIAPELHHCTRSPVFQRPPLLCSPAAPVPARCGGTCL